MKPIIDNFSIASADYARYRPESPAELFDFLFGQVQQFGAAWDCGTGNGQVAKTLADRFQKVFATDISAEQLKLAPQKDNITYLLERAELTSLPDSSIDLITIAQAIHWFDFDKFYAEVNRVAKPGAVIAAWTYVAPRIDPAINELLDLLENTITGPYWNKERKWVDDAYRTIPFPFTEIPAPVFPIIKQFTLDQLLGYLHTWSGVNNYIRQMQKDPLDIIAADLKTAWGKDPVRDVVWKVYVRAGRVV